MSNDIKTWPATKTIVPVSVEEFKKRQPALLGAIREVVREELAAREESPVFDHPQDMLLGGSEDWHPRFKVTPAFGDGDEVMFVASDIAKILGYRDAANLTRNLDGDERGTHEVSTPSGTQNMTVLTESGLYRAILNRETAYVKNEEAQAFVKRFQRWVTHEVLPSIRKTGGYIPTSESDSDEDIMARAVLVAQKTIKQKNQQIAEQQTRIVELEPKARFADAVAASDGTCLVGELAKMLRQNGMDIGQNRLFRLLQADGYLGKSGSNRNVPTQRAMDLGLFRIKETTVTHADGHTTVSRTPKVTGKGQRYFIDRYWGRAQPSLEAGA